MELIAAVGLLLPRLAFSLWMRWLLQVRLARKVKRQREELAIRLLDRVAAGMN